MYAYMCGRYVHNAHTTYVLWWSAGSWNSSGNHLSSRQDRPAS